MGAEGYEVQFSTDRTFTDADEVIERTAEQMLQALIIYSQMQEAFG